MGSNFSKIKMGAMFTTSDGETYKKTSELTFDDMIGIEHYIDPFIDKKIGPGAVPSTGGVIDTSARVVKEPAVITNAPAPKVKKKSKTLGKTFATKKVKTTR
jgi:hypothetical protein